MIHTRFKSTLGFNLYRYFPLSRWIVARQTLNAGPIRESYRVARVGSNGTLRRIAKSPVSIRQIRDSCVQTINTYYSC